MPSLLIGIHQVDGSCLKRRLQEGQALVQSGRLEDAEQHYIRLIADYPESSGAFLHLGNIYILQKRWADAIQRLRAGATIDPASKKLRTSLARALLKNGDVFEAIALLQQEQGEGVDAKLLLLLQQCYVKVCDWPAVEEIGARLLELLPADDPTRDAVLNIRHKALVEIETAIFDGAAQAGDFTTAIEGLRDVTSRHPTSAIAWLKFGTLLGEAEQYEEAAIALRTALRLRPGDAKLRARLTQLVVRTCDDDEVLRYVQDAIACGTADPDCHHWLGKFFYNNRNWGAALESAQNALVLHPQHNSAQFLLAKSLLRLNRLSEALDQLDLLLSVDPNRTAVLQLKADIFVRLARVDDAIRLYRTALRKAPDNPLINHRLSNALLLKGDVAGSHRLHESRRKLGTFIDNNKNYPFLDWKGELHIEGRLLVWSEFGLGVGQNILHMTFLKSLVALGLDVVFEVEPRLVELCQRSFPDIAVIPNDAELPAGISHHTPVASLGRWFKPDLASFASMQPYFLPDVQAVKALRRELQNAAGEGKLLIGISWTSNNPLVGDVKSVQLDQLLVSLASPDLTLVNLQYGDHSKEIQEAVAKTGKQLMDSGIDTTNDIDGLAALIAALDLVVCIGHTTAHIAGAVGTPNFVLLPTGPFAHWLGQGDKCIWYPATTLFRQAPVDQDWRPVIAQVGDAVGHFLNHYRPECWLSTTLLQGLQPSPASGGTLPPQELCDAVECFSAQGAYRSALELIDRLSADQLTKELQIKRADMLALVGSWEQARAIYVALRQDDSLDLEVERQLLSVNLNMYDLEAALPVAACLAKEAPACGVTVANILHHQRRNQEALRELRALSLESPEAEGLSTLTGTVLLELGEFGRAQAYLADQTAMKRLPQDYSLLGRALSAQGRHDEALAAYDKGLSLSKLHPSANFWRTQERVKVGSASLMPLPPLQGEFPSVSTDDLVVFFAADSGYFWHHGLLLLESIGRNSPRAKCHVHVINPDSGIPEGVEIIRGLLPDFKLSYSYEHVSFGDCSTSHIRTYFASVRFVRLAEVFARSPATYLCVDADCIVRRDIQGGAAKLEVGDVALRMRYDDRPNLTVAAGALVLHPTVTAGQFIGHVAALIRSTLEAREAVWFLDQIVLSHVVRGLGGQARLDQLEMEYIDWFFRDESVIWTGKGKRKSEDARYTREIAKYVRIQDNDTIKELMGRAIATL